MKNISIKLLKLNKLILFSLISLLGFTTSCEKSDEPEVCIAYGVPTTKFVISGKVISKTTQQSIFGIQVSLQGDTTYSDTDGNYLVETSYEGTNEFTVSFEDTDSKTNGSYTKLDTTFFINSDTTKLNIQLSPEE
jgi:putative lipoprotein (rSAM/lipoprotein system)